MEQKREGGCACGALRYEISGAPKTDVIRHCRDCQAILKPGTLDDPSSFAPASQLWVSRKQSWLEPLDLPSFERQPG